MPTEVFARSADAFNGVVVAPRPFEADAVALHAMPEGWTIAQMVERLEADGALDPAVRPWLRVVLNDRMLPADEWSAVPAIGDALVIEVAAMARSNPVRTLLQIAVVALATFVGGALGGVPGAIASAAITIGGMAIVNAIAPIKQPDVAQRQERYSLDGGSNSAAPHEAMPIVLGRRRIYPRRCANWYTRTVNNVVYLRMMFQPSVGWVDHASPRLGETDVESYQGVTLRWRTRPDEAIEPIYFGNITPLEKGWGVPITADAGWVTRAFPMEADTLSADFSFMAGLYETKESSGNPKNRSVTFEFRYGPRGGDPAAATACPWTVGGLKTWTRDKLDAWREGFNWNVPRGEYDMHMRRVTADPGNTAKISDELTLVCLRAFRNEAAVADLTGKPWIEMEIQASEQLNGVPQDFNFIATSIVPQATAAGPGALIATRNPADLYLAASYPPFSDVELDEDERNFAAIAAWRATCAARGWNCDLAENGELSVGELLQRVAAMGRARPTLDFGALSVVVDWEKPLPRQMFTPRNVSGFVGELNYAEEIHALRLRFQNEDKNYDDDIAVVFAPGYDLDTATLYSAVEIRDKSNLDEVEREGVRLLAEPRLRPETFTFEQDWESLAIGEGDRAYLAHHVALVGEVSGRVAAQVVDLDTPGRKGLRLDELVVMEAGRSYDLAWRPSADAAVVVLPLDTVVGQGDHVWFPLPAPANLPQPGDLVTVFEHAVELLDVVVNRISPAEGLKAEISCVPYAPELQALVEGEIPAYRTAASRPGGIASASIVKRTVRAVDQVIEQIGGAVDEAGKGIEAIGDGTGMVAGRPGSELNAAVAAADALGAAANLAASTALSALQDPSNGALVRLDRMSKKGSGGALNPNGDFRDWPTSSPYPTGYGFWVAPTALARASTPQGDALDMTSGAGQQCGFLIQAAAMSPPAAGASKVVLEADIELVSGGLAGAALYLQADDGSPGFGNAAGVAVRFTDVAGAGVAGKSYRIRSEPLSLPYVASWTRYVLIAMNHWTGAGSIAAANRIRWLRAEAFVASDVEAGYAEDIALLTGADSVAAARISGVEAKQRSLPNLVKNGDASASTTADPLKSWAASAAGMVEPAYDAGYGSLWRLKANATGASYYFETALSAAPPSGSAMAFSLSGAPGDGTRRYYVAWYNAGAYVAETAPVALTAATLDWEDKRAPLLTSVPAGANQFKVVVVSPAGAGEALLTRLMVNRGASPVPFNNAATDREGLARTAAVELGLVTSDAALANLTNRVGVSMQQGSSIVANARFGAYTNPTGVPDGWLDAALGSTATRQNGQGGHFAPRFVVAAGQDKAIRQVVYLTPGRWVMEFQAWISAGDALGAGMQISRVDNGAALGVLRCASDPDDNGGVGQGGPGIRRWTKTIDVTYAGDVNIYAFAGYTGLGAVTAKVIDLFVVDLWPVSAPVRAAQADASTALTGVSNLTYSLSTLEGQTNARFTSPTGEVQVAKSQAIAQSLANTNQAISDFNLAALSSAGGLSATASAAFSTAVDAATKLAVGRIMLETVGGGGAPSRLLIYSDEYGGSAVVLSAKQIGFGDNTLFDDVTDTLRTVTGGVARVIAWGAPFGSSADLLEWIGDASIALAAMSKANAYYFTSSTAPYVGGSGLPSGGAVDAVLSKSAEAANLTPNTATHTIVAQIDFGAVAASDLVEGWLGFSGVGATLSSVGAWVGGWEIVEQTTAGGSTHVVGSGGLQIEDAGGGFLDFQVTPDGAGTWSALTPRNLNGSVRYALRLWRVSGPDLGGDGITAVLRVRRTP